MPLSHQYTDSPFPPSFTSKFPVHSILFYFSLLTNFFLSYIKINCLPLLPPTLHFSSKLNSRRAGNLPYASLYTQIHLCIYIISFFLIYFVILISFTHLLPTCMHNKIVYHFQIHNYIFWTLISFFVSSLLFQAAPFFYNLTYSPFPFTLSTEK